jgi:hypothetical protein
MVSVSLTGRRKRVRSPGAACPNQAAGGTAGRSFRDNWRIAFASAIKRDLKSLFQKSVPIRIRHGEPAADTCPDRSFSPTLSALLTLQITEACDEFRHEAGKLLIWLTVLLLGACPRALDPGDLCVLCDLCVNAADQAATNGSPWAAGRGFRRPDALSFRTGKH